jgi:hypothetical protein
MKMIKTNIKSGLMYEAPECTIVRIDVMVPLCVSMEEEEQGNSGIFEEFEW